MTREYYLSEIERLSKEDKITSEEARVIVEYIYDDFESRVREKCRHRHQNGENYPYCEELKSRTVEIQFSL